MDETKPDANRLPGGGSHPEGALRQRSQGRVALLIGRLVLPLRPAGACRFWPLAWWRARLSVLEILLFLRRLDREDRLAEIHTRR